MSGILLRLERLVMDLPAVEPFRCFWRRVIYDLAVPQIHLSNSGHVLITKSKIPDSQIFLHTVPVDRFRNNGYTTLYVPAQHHLGHSFVVFFSNGRQYLVLEYPMGPFSQETPCLGLDS
mgnify:CR=1 FL=1